MDLTGLVPYLLFLHVLGAIVAFGPTFAFPLIGGMGGKEPMHANFATRVSLAIEERIVLPLVMVQGVTGVLLIIAAQIDITKLWLLIAIPIYVTAVVFSIRVQKRRVERVIELTSSPPPPGAPPGPPPELLAAVKAVQQGGMLLTVAVVVIVLLMVTKPAL